MYVWRQYSFGTYDVGPDRQYTWGTTRTNKYHLIAAGSISDWNDWAHLYNYYKIVKCITYHRLCGMPNAGIAPSTEGNTSTGSGTAPTHFGEWPKLGWYLEPDYDNRDLIASMAQLREERTAHLVELKPGKLIKVHWTPYYAMDTHTVLSGNNYTLGPKRGWLPVAENNVQHVGCSWDFDNEFGNIDWRGVNVNRVTWVKVGFRGLDKGKRLINI